MVNNRIFSTLLVFQALDKFENIFPPFPFRTFYQVQEKEGCLLSRLFEITGDKL